MVELTVLAAIGWHSKPRITNLQCCPEPTLFCFLPGVSWRANHQSCHWCRKWHIVSRIAILLHCRIGDLLSPLSSARLWCLVSASRWSVLIYMCKYMGLHLGLQYIVRRISIRDAEILSVGKIAEFTKFAGGERRKSPGRCSFIYPGRRRGYCWWEEDWRSDGVQRSGTEAEWQSSDSLCPLGQVFWRLVRLKSWPGFNVQRWRQRVFEDLLAVLEVSPVRWE